MSRSTTGAGMRVGSVTELARAERLPLDHIVSLTEVRRSWGLVTRMRTRASG